MPDAPTTSQVPHLDLSPSEAAANAAVLAHGWRLLVSEGTLVAEAGGARFGVRPGLAGPEDFAEIEGRIETGRKRRVAGPALMFQHSPAREHKPGGRRDLIPGRQIHPSFEGDGRPCRFLEDEPDHPHSIGRRNPLAWLGVGSGWAVLPNLSPFEPAGTFVVVPSPRVGEYPHEPQRLDREAVAGLLAMGAGFDRHLAFFNSAHAGASVNHRHLQLVAVPEELPIENAPVAAHDGFAVLADYPAHGLAFDVSRSDARERLLHAVERLEARHRFYNLVVLGRRAWLFGRNPDREVVEGFPGIIAGYELAGVILFARSSHYQQAEAAAVARVLSATTLPVAELADLVR